MTPRSDQRRRLLAQVHIAKKELCLDDVVYREILAREFGVESSAKLSVPQLRDLVDYFATKGFVRTTKTWKPRRKADYPGRPANIGPRTKGRDGQLKKIEALLTTGGKPWSYADTLARRICKVDKIGWVRTADLFKIITALMKQAVREGWELDDRVN